METQLKVESSRGELFPRLSSCFVRIMDSDEDIPIAQLLLKRKANGGTPSKPPAPQASPVANNKKRRIIESEDDATPAKKAVAVVATKTSVKVEKTVKPSPKIKAEPKEPKAPLVIPKPVKAAAVADDEDDDDIPIYQLLMQRKSLQLKTFNVPKPVKAADVKAADYVEAPKKTRTTTTTTSRTVTARTSSQANRTASRIQDFYNDTDKGYLLQTLLVRWWYAIEWPDRNSIGTAPAGYEELDGFPGVFVESLGKIMDLRDKSTCPCFSNLYTKSSDYIKEQCIKALEKQMEVLRAAEGDEAPLLIDLQQTLKKVKKISPSAADTQAKKFGVVL